jgi:hypothetical protein
VAESQWRIGDEQRNPNASNANTEGEHRACWNKCAMDISANVRGCDCCVTARLSRIRAALTSRSRKTTQETPSAERDDPSYATLGAKLRIPESVIKKLIYRMRQRYRVLLREEVRQTVETLRNYGTSVAHSRRVPPVQRKTLLLLTQNEG